MDDPAAWRELAARFTELGQADRHQLYASWSSIAFHDRGDHWFIAGSPEQPIIESFQWAAERAAVLLGQQPGEATLFFWLDLLKEGSPRYSGGGTSERYLEDRLVERADTGTITCVCLASAEYCYKLETAAIARQSETPKHPESPELPLTPEAARIALTSANMMARAAARAQEEFLVEKMKNELRLKEAQAAAVNIVAEPSENSAPPHFPNKQAERAALRRAYFDRFPEKIMLLDVCWAAKQRYREWTRWIRGDLKDGSKPDRAFRAVLTSGKRPEEYRPDARPKSWK